MKELNLDVAGDFLLMASKLIHIKSKMLLPRIDEKEQESVEDPRRELVERLIEHERFRAIARTLRDMEHAQSQFVPRNIITDFEVEFELDDISIDELLRAYQVTIGFGQAYNYKDITVNQVDVNEKIGMIINSFRDRKKAKFRELIPMQASRLELIVFFLAMLELIRGRTLKVVQRKFLGNIILYKIEE